MARAEQRAGGGGEGLPGFDLAGREPYTETSRGSTVRDLLNQARAAIDQSPGARPELRVELLGIVGTSLINHQDTEAAEIVLKQAVDEAIRALGPEHPETIRARVRLLSVHRFRGRTRVLRQELDALLPVAPAPRGDPGRRARHRAEEQDPPRDGRWPLPGGPGGGGGGDGDRGPEAGTAAPRDRRGVPDVRPGVRARRPPGRGPPEDGAGLRPDARGVRGRRSIPGASRRRTSTVARSQMPASWRGESTTSRPPCSRRPKCSALRTGWSASSRASSPATRSTLGEIQRALETSETALRIAAEHSDPDSFRHADALLARGESLLAALRTPEAVPCLAAAVQALSATLGPVSPADRRRAGDPGPGLGLRRGQTEKARRELNDVVESQARRERAAPRSRSSPSASSSASRAATPRRCARSRSGWLPSGPARPRTWTACACSGRSASTRSLSASRSKPRLRLEQALALSRALQTRTAPERADVLAGLGSALLARRRPAEALPFLQRSRRVLARVRSREPVGGRLGERVTARSRRPWQGRGLARGRAPGPDVRR